MATRAKMGRRPTEGTPEDDLIQDMCARARQVAGWCDALGFEFRGARRLIEHLTGRTAEGAARGVLPFAGHPDPLELLEDVERERIEDPDLRPYIWELED